MRTRDNAPSSLRGDHPAQLAYLTKPLPNGCWEFTGYIHPNGYGQLGRNTGAHRIAWEVANGKPVPAGLVVDHTCHNADPDCHDNNECPHRRCVNPAHLEAVIQQVNLTRGHGFAGVNAAATHCSEGHPFSDENTYYRPGRFGRFCRICRRERGRRIYAQRGKRLARPDSPVIRTWAIENGIPVADRGAIPRRIRELYEAAQAQPRAA